MRKKIKISLSNVVRATFLVIVFGFISCDNADNKSKVVLNTTQNKSGKISFTINGQTFTSTKNVSALLLNGKFQGCSDDENNKIGDSENMNVNTDKAVVAIFNANDIRYTRRPSNTQGVVLTITAADAHLVKGSFTGYVYLNGDANTPLVPITGSFETTDVFSF